MRRGAGTLIAALLAWAAAAWGTECPECFRAGAATVQLRVPPGTPLGGLGALGRRRLLPDVLGRHPHAFWFKSSTGVRNGLHARALMLEVPPHRFAWLTLDLVAVDRGFEREVRHRLRGEGVPPAALAVSASHTHSGPGAFVDSTVMGWLAVDRFDAEVRRALVGAAVEAVRRADAAKVPAVLHAGTVEAPAFIRSRLGRPLDPGIVVLKVTDREGEPLALLWNFAIHGTVLGARNLELSGDVMGVASAELEHALGVPALFVNGAVGDVSPAGHGERAVADLGGALARLVKGAWRNAQPVRSGSLAVATRRVPLPSARLSLRNCLGQWVPRPLQLPLRGLFSPEAELVAAALGDTAWVTVPGELQSSLGLGIKRALREVFPRVFVAGVSNDYLGYFVAPEDYDQTAYVTCASVHGPGAGRCLADAATSLLRGLADGRGPVSHVLPASCSSGREALR